MIFRVFSARLKPGQRQAYERLCREKSAPHMRAQPGFLTYWLGAPRAERPDDLVFVSVWRDLESVKGFAGERWQEGSILPGEGDLLIAARVQHFDESYRSLTEMWRAVSPAVKRRETIATTAPLTEAQWEAVSGVLATGERRRRGRPRADDRRVLAAVVYVLRTGCRWRDLPPALGSPVTAWRRFTAWEADGTWERIWRALLGTLDTPGKQAWALAFLDSRHVPTKRGRRPPATEARATTSEVGEAPAMRATRQVGVSRHVAPPSAVPTRRPAHATTGPNVTG